MIEVVAKRAIIFSLILGGFIGLLSLIPFFMYLNIVVLLFCTSLAVILFMKKDNKHLGFLTYQQGALLGALIGFFCGIGFFATFSPMAVILHLILKSSFMDYGVTYTLQIAFWLYLIVILLTSILFALTNSVSGMGITFILNMIEKKPENSDAPLEITIDD